MVDQKWFENGIMVCIIISSVQLAIEGPGLDYDSPFVTPFMYAEYTFTGIFILEFVLRVCHKGFMFTNVAYLKSGWNVMDFIIVVSGVIGLIGLSDPNSPVAKAKALRGLRAFRPLKVRGTSVG